MQTAEQPNSPFVRVFTDRPAAAGFEENATRVGRAAALFITVSFYGKLRHAGAQKGLRVAIFSFLATAR